MGGTVTLTSAFRCFLDALSSHKELHHYQFKQDITYTDAEPLAIMILKINLREI